jgi:flagellin
MRINTNVAALNTHRILSGTSIDLSRSIQRLSSGLRINRASDDAAGLAIANRLGSDVRSLQQAQRNVEQAMSVLQIAEGAAQSVKDILVRMKELATQAASDTVSDEQRATLQGEFSKLISELDRIVNSTTFQTKVLLDGTFTGAGKEFTIQVGTRNDANNDRLTFNLADLNADVLGTDGATPLYVADIDISTLTGAQSALTALDDALSDVNNALGDIGAYQNRLEYAARSIATAIENFSAAEGTIRDVDMAREMVSLTRSQILQQAGVAMLAQANASPQLVLRLLG